MVSRCADVADAHPPSFLATGSFSGFKKHVKSGIGRSTSGGTLCTCGGQIEEAVERYLIA